MKPETVTRVIDYRTFRTKSRKHSVRLANLNKVLSIRGQTMSKKRLERLILGEKVCVTTLLRDCYGRSIARVAVDGKSVNLIMNKFLRRK